LQIIADNDQTTKRQDEAPEKSRVNRPVMEKGALVTLVTEFWVLP
jgi:hypothetical protein